MSRATCSWSTSGRTAAAAGSITSRTRRDGDATIKRAIGTTPLRRRAPSTAYTWYSASSSALWRRMSAIASTSDASASTVTTSVVIKPPAESAGYLRT